MRESGYKELIRRLESVRRRFYGQRLVKGLLTGGGLILLLSIVLVFLEYVFGPDQKTRGLMLWIGLLTTVVVSVFFLLIPILRYLGWVKRFTLRELAREIERRQGAWEGKLRAPLELKEGKDLGGGLLRQAVEQKSARVNALDLESGFSWREVLRWWPMLVVPIGLWVLALMGGRSEDFAVSSNRILRYASYEDPVEKLDFRLINDSLQVYREQDFEFKVELQGKDRGRESLYCVVHGQRLRMARSGLEYKLNLRKLKEDLQIELVSGELRSDPLVIQVIQRPILRALRLNVSPPKYTGEVPWSSDLGERLRVPEGSTIEWEVKAEGMQKRVVVIREAGDKRTLAEDEPVIKALKNFSFDLVLVGEDQDLEVAKEVPVEVIPDRKPIIDYRFKGDDTSIVISYGISDDYGLIKANWWLRSGEKVWRRGHLSMGQGELVLLKSDTIFKQGGDFSLWFEAVDNKRPKAQQTKVEVWGEKRMSQADQEARQLTETNAVLQKWRRELEDAKGERVEMSKSMDAYRANEWELKKELSKRLEEMREEVSERKEQRERMQELDTLKAKEEEWKEKEMEIEALVKEIEKLMEEMRPEELRDKLEKLDQAQNELRRDKAQEVAMRRSLLEKMEMLRAAKELKEMARRQKEFSEQRDEQKLIEEQERRYEKLEEQLNELSEGKYGEPLRNRSVMDKMRKVGENLKQQSDTKANDVKLNQMQKDASERMQELSDLLMAAMQEGETETVEMNLAALRQLLANLELLSFNTERIAGDLRIMERNDPGLKALLKEQKMQQLAVGVIEDSLLALAERAPQIRNKVFDEIGRIKENQDAALSSSQEVELNKAGGRLQVAMMAANELALMLDAAKKNMMAMLAGKKKGTQNCEKPGGKKPGQGNAAQRMNGLSKQLGGERGEKPGEAGDGLNGREIARILAEQEAIRQLLEEAAGKQGKGGNKALREFDEANKRWLEGQLNDTELKKRYEEISGRLLEDERAARERGQRMERQAEEAESKRDYREGKKANEESEQIDIPASIWFAPLSLEGFYQGWR